MIGLHCFLQTEKKQLFLVPSLYSMALLFKYFSIVLRNVRESRGRHDNADEKMKIFLFHLCIVDLGTIMGFLDKFNKTSNKLNRTLKAQF